MNPIELYRLSERLGYTFKNTDLLLQALTHRSFEGALNNERLEFLGDSVLSFAITEALFHKHPEASEGELTRLRSSLVKGETLSEMAKELGLGDLLRLGLGELSTGGFRRASTLEDAFEALIGAIFLDSDFNTAKTLLLKWFDERLKIATPETAIRDSKSRLQEWLQAKGIALPTYEVLQEEGPDHNKIFHVKCNITVLNVSSEAEGVNKKNAEQKAAEKLLASLIHHE